MVKSLHMEGERNRWVGLRVDGVMDQGTGLNEHDMKEMGSLRRSWETAADPIGDEGGHDDFED